MNSTNPAFTYSDQRSHSQIDPRDKKKIFGNNQDNATNPRQQQQYNPDQSYDDQQTNKLLEIYEKEIDQLKKEVNQHRRSELSQSASGKDVEKYQLAVVHLNNELEKAKKQVFDLQVELDRKQQLEQQLQKALSSLNKARQVIDEKNNELFNMQRMAPHGNHHNNNHQDLLQLQEELNSYKMFLAENNPEKLNDILKEQANEIEQLKFERQKNQQLAEQKSREFSKLLSDNTTMNKKFNDACIELNHLKQLCNEQEQHQRSLKAAQEQVQLQTQQLNYQTKEISDLRKFKDQYYQLSQENNQMGGIIENQKKRLSKQEEEIKLFNDHLVKYKEEIQSLTGQIINGQKFNEKTKQYEHLLHELESQNQQLLTENKDYELLLDKFQKETTYLNQKIETLQLQLHQQSTENDEQLRLMEKFKSEIQFLNDKLMQSQYGAMDTQKQEYYIQQLQNEILYFNSQVAQLKEDVKRKEDENQRLNAMISRINQDLNQKQLSSSITYKDQNFEISQLQDELQQLSSKLAEFEKIKQINERRFEDLHQQNQGLIQQNGFLQSQLGANEEQLQKSIIKQQQMEQIQKSFKEQNKEKEFKFFIIFIFTNRNQYQKQQQEIENLKAQLASANQEKQQLQQIITSKDKELSMFYNEADKSEAQSKSLIKSLKDELDKQKLQSQNSQEQATQLYYKLNDSITENSNLQQEIQRLKQQILDVQENQIKEHTMNQSTVNQIKQYQILLQKKDEEIQRINELLNMKKIEAQNAINQCNEMRKIQAQLAMSPQRI